IFPPVYEGVILSRDLIRWPNSLCHYKPGARLLLHTEGDANVRAVLERIDGIEALGIAAIDVSPAYWRTLGNRLAARLALPEYTTERHTAWLAGKVLP
ncbi:DUF2840 domain-containing protein, partial [Aeromonas caviae]